MTVFSHAFFPVLSRIIAALLGGYLLANAIAILLSYGLPGSRADSVMSAIFISFFIYAGAVLWVFSAATAWKAWLGVLIPGVASAVTVVILKPQVWL